jgi:hypothetical protein
VAARRAISHACWVIAVAACIAIGTAAAVGRYAAVRQARIRRELFTALQPPKLANCHFERYGEAHDGGYLLCGNLLSGVGAGFSYGISGYDGWGCDISRTLGVSVHQYDCFDLQQPVCAGGRTIFHAECIGDRQRVEDGRAYDSVVDQIPAEW